MIYTRLRVTGKASGYRHYSHCTHRNSQAQGVRNDCKQGTGIIHKLGSSTQKGAVQIPGTQGAEKNWNLILIICSWSAYTV